MAYKVLPKMRGSSTTSPAIHVTKDSFRFNKAARAEFGIDAFSHAEIYQDDEDTTKAAIKLLNEDTKDANTIKNGGIAGGSWIKHYKLAVGVYPLTLNSEDGLLEFVAVGGKAGAHKNDNTEDKSARRTAKAA